jgi:large subunit ribosomal protein L24
MAERAPKFKLRQGDKVVVLSGKDVGKEGTITRVITDRGTVIVEGVNLAKRHQRPTKSTMQGGIIDKDMPIPMSNVAIVCPSCNGPSRVGYRIDGGEKRRVCKKCDKDL